jgi:hypothetical protein
MKKTIYSTAAALAVMFVLGLGADLYAQGRGAGRPAGAGGGRPDGVGNPGGASGGSGVDRGLGNASGRSDGRSDSGIDRARLASNRANAMSDNELNRYRGISRKLGTTPEEMRDRYEAALLTNPDLKYGQFVAAHVVADNLGTRFPDVTAAHILLGYENGDSLGRSLHNLGLTKQQSKDAERLAEDRIKEAKKRN